MPHRGEPDLLIHGGSIRTLDPEAPVVRAMLVRDGRVLACGEERDLLPLATSATVDLDLEGGCAIPGINDSHLHGAWFGALWPQTVFGKELDPGVFADSGEPTPGGKDEPQGRLIEGDDELFASIRRTQRVAASLGITSYTEPGLGPGEDLGPTGAFGARSLAAYRSLAARGELTARVTGLALFGLVDGPSTERDLLDGLDEIRGVGGEDVPLGVAASRARADSFWRIPGIKVFADGVPPARSAWTSSCYPDGSHGRLLVEPGLEEGDALAGLTRMIGAVHRGGFQLGVHATGDRSIDAVAAALAQFPVDGVRAARHYIIHGDLISVDGIRAAARLGLGYNAQPLISKVTHGALGAAVGQSVAAEAWPLKALTNAGVSVALSSDAPIVPPTWLDALAAADELLGEAIDPAARAEALLRSMTVEAARQDHAEHVKGRLQPGYLADVTVLSEDPVAVGAAAFPRLQVTHTLSGGRLVHSPLEPALP